MKDVPKKLHVTTPTGDRRTITLTHHARQRIKQMGVDLCEVARAVTAYDCWYLGSDQSGRTRVQRCDDGDIAVVVAHHEDVVITVLEHTTEDYTRPEGAHA